MKNCLSHWKGISNDYLKVHHTLKRMLLLLTTLCILLTSLFTQQTIKGRITSSDSVFAGATIQVKGTPAATQTDAGGSFIITASPNAVLIISAVGFATQEVRVAGRPVINVQLQSATQEIEEVVVVGYGKQKKINLTGAVAAVSGTELNKRVVTNPSALLQGKLPGLSVVENSGEPGNEGVSLRIRGYTSFSSAGNNPLVIVDGIPGSLNALNPNDIESVTLLKDAASAAIYGTRGANGVILITTKKGKQGRFNLEYNYNLGVTSPSKTLDLITNSVEYMTLFNKAAMHSGQATPYPQSLLINTKIHLIL